MDNEIAEHLSGIAACVLAKKIVYPHLETGEELSPTRVRPESSRVISKENDEDEDDKNAPNDPTKNESFIQSPVEKSILVDIAKADHEEQTVTGVVLQPEVVDAQGDIMSAQVIKESAHNFLAAFNKGTKLGVQHSIFKAGQLELVESFIAPIDMVLGLKTVKAGSWIMTVKVLSAAALHTYDVLAASHIILSEDAVARLEERLGQ